MTSAQLDSRTALHPVPLPPALSEPGHAAPLGATPKLTRRWNLPWFLSALGCLIILGAVLRIYPSAAYKKVGYDEQLYQTYVEQVSNVGILSYPDMVENYIAVQTRSPDTYLPPTRFLYIYGADVWMNVFGGSAIGSLRAVSCLFSILTLVMCAAWGWRLGGHAACLALTALMTCAPVEIHLAQHAMIDGFFAFWALLTAWALWESLRAPASIGWQFVLTLALAGMVLTKENSFFIYVSLCGLLALNDKVRFGTITPRLLLIMVLGPLVGMLTLFFLSGGVENFLRVYQLLVARAYTLDYAIRNCDGPWYRYLVDLLISSPLILLLAVAAACNTRFHDKNALYLLSFVFVSYLIMCNIKYGMNLRYATTWDFPLRYLALGQLTIWSQTHLKYRHWILGGSITLLCLFDLRQYYIFFVQHGLYELITTDLLQAVKILKP